MRAKRSALRRAFISIYHTRVQNDIRVWTVNKRRGKTWHVLSLQQPGEMWSVWWMAETWMSRHRMGSSPFLVPALLRPLRGQVEAGQTCPCLDSSCYLFFFPDIIGGLSVRPANGLLHWSVKAVSFPRFSIWLRKLLSRRRLEQLMIYSQAQDGFCCNNLPDQAGSDCHSE